MSASPPEPHRQPIEEPWCVTTPKRPTDDHAAGEWLKSVGTALDVLECFAADSELGVSDIARRLGIAKSTAHRLLTTLGSRGMVEQNPDNGQYRLGIHLYELGQLAHARNGLRHAALPVMREVCRSTGFTVNLSVPDGPDVVFVERLVTQDSGRLLGHTGRRLPAHCTSSGKVIAAHNPKAAAARLKAGFPPRASHTVRSASEWNRMLEQVRKVGHAVSHSESFEGATSVAVPVFDRSHTAIAAISVFGPTDVMRPDIERVVPLLTAAARRISKALGA